MARIPLNGSPKVTNKFKTPGWGSLGAHLGIDYGVPVGTPVYAPVGGTINLRQTTSGKGSGGKQLQLAGDDGKWHRFLHLSEQLVSQGQRVAEGQLIGRSGATGDVTGPHLHWDVRAANTTWNASLNNYVDPEAWIAQLSTQPQPTGNTYTVKKGDTLSKVFGTNWKAVYEANKGVIGPDPNKIKPGQVLTVPGSRVHTVVKGETLSGIAKKYSTTWQKLKAANGIANENLIKPGQKITIV